MAYFSSYFVRPFMMALSFTAISSGAQSQVSSTPVIQVEDEKGQIQSLLKATHSLPFTEKVYHLCKAFVGVPYGFGGPLGEGPQGNFSKKPLWRLDTMDCTTYVETVMALSLAKDFEDFCEKMNQIRYRNGVISYVSRNHFTDVDWVPNNKAYLKDITLSLQADAPVLSYVVDKKKWYEKTAPLQKELSPAEKNVFAHQGDNLPLSKAQVPYIKKEEIVSILEENKEKMIHPLIFNLVGDKDYMEKAIGTPYSIYHQGFIFWTPDGLFAFHATAADPKTVVKLPLEEYIKQINKNDNLWGFNILTFHPPKN